MAKGSCYLAFIVNKCHPKKDLSKSGRGVALCKVNKNLNYNGDQDEGDYYEPKQEIRVRMWVDG